MTPTEIGTLLDAYEVAPSSDVATIEVTLSIKRSEQPELYDALMKISKTENLEELLIDYVTDVYNPDCGECISSDLSIVSKGIYFCGDFHFYA